ncbi:NADPH--hemoprotein reductase SCDLUD_004592 [Saccharomycodes ludwigii]|uniref:NADPH--hemoprotein reductase n=1 Tax=Saccharomycodes ludwigii TaxID=36035 RepID=UPI001E83F484|nr:hypothetical protein SCDLUD_004592 [Saccharomycodes ludwigii]KAH3899163.1 hypothetical protein SCDLUD_004592 [Saccharomycodes ludwigii]
MPFGLDTLDFSVLVALVIALFTYLNKDKLLDVLKGSGVSDSSITSSSLSRDIVEVLKENNKNYLVLYGSQTGTTEDYAKKFAKELMAKFGGELNVMCGDLENYDFDNLNELPANIIVSIFISTYGEGDFPDSSIPFEDYLNSLDPSEKPLSSLKFTLFGLGNSTYEFFNGAGKKCKEKLIENGGAQLIGEYGEADDGMGSTDDDYTNWKDKILVVLKDKLKLDEHEQVFQPSYKLTNLNEIDNSVSLGEPSIHYIPIHKDEYLSYNSDKHQQLGPFDTNYPYVAPITQIKELCNPKSGRSCCFVEFDVSGSNMKYSTGDHIGIWPSNSNEAVNQFVKCFQLDESKGFSLTPLDSTVKLPFPAPTTIGACVRYYLEITGPISRQFFSSVAQFAPTEELKAELEKLSKDKNLFHSEIISQYYNVADALLKLSGGAPWNTVPWEFLIETIPRLQPRYYSICSSSSMDKQLVHVCCMVEQQVISQDRVSTGVTTNFLKQIECKENGSTYMLPPVSYDLGGPRGLYNKNKLPLYIRKSGFKLPSNPSTPVIMVGPGTGVAPFRGFIRERVEYVKKQTDAGNNVNLGKHMLFYGSRDSNDALFMNEWEEYKKMLGNDDTFQLHLAQSRVPGAESKYVQDAIKKNAVQLVELLNQGGFIYVCGDAKNMAKDVHRNFGEILAEQKNISYDDAVEMLKMMKVSGKYQEDVW